ncbi:MAG: hypothetical protein CVU51_00910 [Deltaproteobacteria bacterium HGW-Deltaproteobacteria-1]|jgi:hypothetical protein|nr:MAG: hypothetical protein CVU51_00910 [Deltaproteobacteria bacterium HGW-Deltaproteobacteria-1]
MMDYILLAGAALNFTGSLKMFREICKAPPLESDSEEYLQLKLFVAGVAATFGSLYVYLFFNPALIVPILIFGAALKSWAFITSLVLYRMKLLRFKAFSEFGLSNGIVAVLFWVLIGWKWPG